jgi:UDP-glucose 4-epimerase
MKMDNRKKILVTGSNGFIGCNLCAFLEEKGYFVRGTVRNNVRAVSAADEYIQVGDINELTDWQQALVGVDTVIHLAARVHIMHKTAIDPVESFHKVNVLGTERLARMAAQAGVKRFIFISSVKVNGEDAYGISKLAAENILKKIS